MSTGSDTEAQRCRDCGKALSARNASGYCRRHAAARAMSDPVNRAKVSLGRKRSFQLNPELREREAERMRQVRMLPQARAARGRNLIGGEIAAKNNAARPAGSPSRVAAGVRGSATKLAWCPPHLRETYRRIAKKKGVSTSEARALILEQHEAELKRWRREHGYPEPKMDEAA